MTDCKMGLVKVSGHGQPSHADRGRAESCSGRELESRGCGQGQTVGENWRPKGNRPHSEHRRVAFPVPGTSPDPHLIIPKD